MSKKYDVIIIGAGISGCAVAWRIARYDLDILLLDKEADIATGTTKANTGIIHAGYNADPKKLKGRLNNKGNIQIKEIVKDLNIPFEEIGSLVVGVEGDDLSVLDDLLEKGRENGVEGLEIVDKEWLRENEPNIAENAVAALWAPTAGVITPWEFALAMAENAVENGAEVQLETKVEDILIEDDKVVGVKTNQGEYKADYVVNAAGVYADEISKMAGVEKVDITPRKGEYYIYDHAKDFELNHVVFPIPTPVSKGIVVAPTVEHNILIGPTSETADSKEDLSTSSEGLEEVYTGAKKLFPELDLRDTIRVFSGLRAADKTEDFVIEAAKNVKGFVNVAGIQSPGLSSAPAIADLTAEILEEEGLKLSEKDNIIEKREEPVRFYEMSNEERAEYVDQDKDYGQIICRCETVSYKEIVDAINGPVGARTVNAVKRRTRAGAGRCQGGFCGPKVVEILADELGLDPTEIKQEENNSKILDYKIKELLESKVSVNA
ncbi:NAD(P)/FAD-dependent oxidoreductase [Halanaerobium sp. Z-7514]|uniref:NAD(P)/FAD-dependent oxidoreductase n=1 Tax=Halanaerobium polyolivorans TaxID=2886943 RepID=A0AAW4X2K0_9FIRM|nr:NAD(P)/FAD-dependent oxidoreductase [Halanaerobium polyolivorans]MCC3146027.1 NAD(P)/FAD-dependent oxidoreductase [Halanaerobium polyolivorans]RQD75985.1 MAG: FAD/NAD(P)-binding oxidoreductase [Halanaerobium sp. MSAO_Bac5]